LVEVVEGSTEHPHPLSWDGLEEFDDSDTTIVMNNSYFSIFPVTQIVAHGSVVWYAEIG
jgi:hypothetical protein